MGKCSYYLLKTDTIVVEAENVPCSGIISKVKVRRLDFIQVFHFNLFFYQNMNIATNSDILPSCTKSVTVKFKDGGKDTVIHMTQDKVVYVNNVEVKKLPRKMMNGLVKIREASSSFIIVDFQDGVKVWWDGINRVYIDAPATLRGQTKGLCGTFNSNLQDDLLTPEGDIENSIEPFADKWRTDENCESMTGKNVPSPCQVNAMNRDKAEQLCSKIKSNVFSECHWIVDPEVYYENCLYDVCACPSGDFDACACQIMSSYASECARQGAVVEWRTKIPSCAIKCPPGQIYEQCGNSCTLTTHDIQSEDECM